MIARLVTGIAVLAAVIGALVVGGHISVEQPETAHRTTVSVTPARQDVACPGPLVTPAGGTGSDPELGGAATNVTGDIYLSGTTRAVGTGTASDALVGSAVERVGGGDISGLAALTCTAPSNDQWIVAGETTVGASARLVLTNPSDVAVEATVAAFGELGDLDESRVVAIGPNAQAEVLLEGAVVDVAALVLHITASGTGVVAALQDSRLDGFQPNGTDWAVASAIGNELAIPGVGTGGSANVASTVRLMAPEGATAHLALSTPDGAELWEGVSGLELEPGVVVEVSVPSVDVGTVTISADAPVVAAAFSTQSRPATAGVEGDTAQELRWIPSQLVGDDNERAAVTVGYDELVVVYSAQAGTFSLTDSDGNEVGTAQLTAGDTATVAVKAPPGTVISARGAAAWTVLVSDGALFTAMGPERTTIDAQNITVEQRRYVPIP